MHVQYECMYGATISCVTQVREGAKSRGGIKIMPAGSKCPIQSNAARAGLANVGSRARVYLVEVM